MWASFLRGPGAKGKLSLTSDLESDKDGLCCLCGRTERSQPLSDPLCLRMCAFVGWLGRCVCLCVYERKGTFIPTANQRVSRAYNSQINRLI